MDKLLRYVEKLLVWSIIVVISVILILAFIDVIYEIVESVKQPPFFVVNADQLMSMFSMFLVILIGLELIETIKAYLKDYCVHVEHVVLVAIIAVARKVIVWEFDRYTYKDLYSLAAMIIALGITYFLVRRSGIKIRYKPSFAKKGNIESKAACSNYSPEDDEK
jgi:uncharacterized membrane protein (DUF373 family)